MYRPRVPHRQSAIAVAAFAALLAGCATPTPPLSTWRVEPSYRVSGNGPSVSPGYVALARQYEGERRWRDASEAWRKASLEAPDDVDVLNSLGTAEAGQGRYRDGIAALRRAVALAPERAQILNNLGFALLLDGLTEEAAAVLREALQRDPAHRMARANLDRAEQSLLSRAPASKPGGSADMHEQARLAALGLATHPVSAAGAERPFLPATNEPARAVVQGAPVAIDARVQTAANVAPLRMAGAASVEPPVEPLAKRDEPLAAAQLATAAEPSAVHRAPSPLPVPLPLTPAPAAPAATTMALLPKAPVLGRPTALAAEVLRAPALPGRLLNAGHAGIAPIAPRAGQAMPRIEIANGNGVNGMAARFHGLLRAGGHLHNVVLTNLAAFNAPVSTVYYRPGFATAAKALAARSPYRMEVAEAQSGAAGGADIRVVLGHDARLPAACAPRCLVAATPSAVPAAATAHAPLERADAVLSEPDSLDPSRPSALVAAWLEVLAR